MRGDAAAGRGWPVAAKSGFGNKGPCQGFDLSHVTVHHNSPHPAALGAKAYTDGQTIHLAKGESHHLPHEAWHVVQQQQGKVRATGRLAGGVAVNSHEGLEGEATRMGQAAQQLAVRGKAISAGGGQNRPSPPAILGPMEPVIQRKEEKGGGTSDSANFRPDYPDLLARIEDATGGLFGWGTDEEGLYKALQALQRNQTYINHLDKLYRDKHDEGLEELLRYELDEEELNFALQLINVEPEGKAQEIVEVGPDYAKHAAQRLAKAMDITGTDEEAIYATLLPVAHDADGMIKKIEDAYSGLKNGQETLRDRLADELDTDELAYATFLMSYPFDYYVREANEKLRGLNFAETLRWFEDKEAYDDDYWEVDSETEDRPFLTLKNGVAPSDAVEAIINEQDEWQIDCSQFIGLVRWYALLRTNGPAYFNREFASGLALRTTGTSTGSEPVTIYVRSSADEPMYLWKDGKEDRSVEIPVKEVVKDAPVGSRVKFLNDLIRHDVRDIHPGIRAYLFENTVKLGPDSYGAFPLDAGGVFESRYALTADEVMQAMAEKTADYYNLSTEAMKRYIFLQEVVYLKRPE